MKEHAFVIMAPRRGADRDACGGTQAPLGLKRWLGLAGVFGVGEGDADEEEGGDEGGAAE